MILKREVTKLKKRGWGKHPKNIKLYICAIEEFTRETGVNLNRCPLNPGNRKRINLKLVSSTVAITTATTATTAATAATVYENDDNTNNTTNTTNTTNNDNYSTVVVSEQFQHVEGQERLRMVYDVIMEVLYTPCDPVETGISIPPKLKTEQELELLALDAEEDEIHNRSNNNNNNNHSGSHHRGRGRTRRGSSSSPVAVDKNGTKKTKHQLAVEKLERNRTIVQHSKRKYISTIGYHVSNDLPQYKFLLQPLEFTLILKTPR